MTNGSLIDLILPHLNCPTGDCSLCRDRAAAIIAIVRRHYEGRPAVEGKPLELMTRDELLAYIKQHQPQQPQDAIECVGNAIHEAWHKPGTSLNDVAKAAIVAMGGASDREAEGFGKVEPASPPARDDQRGYPVGERTATLKSEAKTIPSNGESMACEESSRATVRSGWYPLDKCPIHAMGNGQNEAERETGAWFSDCPSCNPPASDQQREMRLLTADEVEAKLLQNSRYLHEPLTGNEKKLIRDVLSLCRTTEPDRCPDCGASMIEVCSGLEINARGEASGLCCHSDYCEKPIKPVMSKPKVIDYVNIAQEAYNAEFAKTMVKPTLYYQAMEAAVKAVLDAAGVKYV